MLERTASHRLRRLSRAGQANFAAGPGPVPGSAGGFRDAAQAAMTAKPVVGPGFGPGAVNATPGESAAQRAIASGLRFPSTWTLDMRFEPALCGSSRRASGGRRHDLVVPAHSVACPACRLCTGP